MTITVNAIYENGALKLEEPVPLKEREKVRVHIEAALSMAEQTAGMIKWAGDHASLERLLAEADELEGF